MQNESDPQNLSIVLNFILSIITLGVSSYVKNRKRKNKSNSGGRKSDHRKRNYDNSDTNADNSKLNKE